MNDAKRYRTNAADCMLAAERSGPAYRNLTFAIAESWLSLTAQQEAIDELLTIWSKARAATSASPKRLPFQYPFEPGCGRISGLQARETISA